MVLANASLRGRTSELAVANANVTEPLPALPNRESHPAPGWSSFVFLDDALFAGFAVTCQVTQEFGSVSV
jgi:hypothetical protein